MGRRLWLARLATRLGGGRPAGRLLSPPGNAGALSVPASTLEDLSALLLKAASDGVEVEDLCACAARLAQATGCALLEWDPLAGGSRIQGAVGTWEERPLRPILEGTVPDWAFALGGAPVCATREGEAVRAFQWGGGGTASGLAISIGFGDQVSGALLFTYSSPRGFTADEVRIGRLIVCHAALVVRQRTLAATVERQAQRIARLVDDVERMLISLRRIAAQNRDERG